MAISNVPWFATTFEGPFGVGTDGIFTTIVRVIQAFVWVWVIILVMLNFFYLDKQIVVNITIYLTVKNTFPFSQWFQNMTSVTSQTKAKCFKWILKKPKNFTCTIVSISFVPWLTGASEWSLGIMAQSFLVTAFKICVTFVYVWNKIAINWQ